MGSVNPIVVTEAALAERSEAIAEGLAASVASFGGQLCTKPGVVFVPAGEAGDAFATDLGARLAASEPQVLLNERLRDALTERVAELGGLAEPVDGAATAAEPGFRFRPAAYRAAAGDVREHPELLEERFGPVVLLLTYGSRDELLDALLRIDGQLTGSVHAQAQDAELVALLAAALAERSGRADLRRLPDWRRGHPRHAPRRAVPRDHGAGAHVGGDDGDPPLPAPGRLPERARARATARAAGREPARDLAPRRRGADARGARSVVHDAHRDARRARGVGEREEVAHRRGVRAERAAERIGRRRGAGAERDGASQRGQASVPLARCPVRATRLSALAPASRVTGSGRAGSEPSKSRWKDTPRV